ncbi:MAG: hypothetical protein DME55_15525 [Verrucomicrobia bacterium]|nr:MAG: hypothetical protein DME55_15525 [Verrucomicrobiota bacterium]
MCDEDFCGAVDAEFSTATWGARNCARPCSIATTTTATTSAADFASGSEKSVLQAGLATRLDKS